MLHDTSLSHDILSHDILSHDILSHDILSHDILSHDILSHDILSHDILSHDILSHCILTCNTLLHWQIVTLTNCHIDKLSHWQIVTLTNCHIDKLSHWQIVALTNCQINNETLSYWHIFTSYCHIDTRSHLHMDLRRRHRRRQRGGVEVDRRVGLWLHQMAGGRAERRHRQQLPGLEQRLRRVLERFSLYGRRQPAFRVLLR